jgi:hypothetical protein
VIGMQAAGTIPNGAVDLHELAPVYERPGPFATVYLGTDRHIDNAEQRSLQRWRAVRRELEERGAPEGCLDAIEEVVAPAHLVSDQLAVIADEHEVLVLHHLAQPLDRDRARWGPLPDAVPVLHARQDDVPFAVVLADRGGADLLGHEPGAREIERVVGDGEPERKVAPGGWSQKRFQQRADEDWAATAREVAEAVEALADRIEARTLVLGGDVRATHLVLERLPARLADLTHVITAGRAVDGSEEEREREIHRLVATAVAEDSVALLERFKEERGQHDRAADGPAATVDALNRAAVAVLLVADVEQPSAWVSAEALPIGLEPATVDVLSEERPIEVPLADALVRAAWATGASVRVIPKAGPVNDGVGALLRWSDR